MPDLYVSPQGMQDDDNIDDEARSLVGKNPIFAKLPTDEEKDQKWAIFGAVFDLVTAARDLYCYNEMSWEEVLDNLSQAVDELKGGEAEMIAAFKKDKEKSEKEGEEKKEEKEEGETKEEEKKEGEEGEEKEEEKEEGEGGSTIHDHEHVHTNGIYHSHKHKHVKGEEHDHAHVHEED